MDGEKVILASVVVHLLEYIETGEPADKLAAEGLLKLPSTSQLLRGMNEMSALPLTRGAVPLLEEILAGDAVKVESQKAPDDSPHEKSLNTIRIKLADGKTLRFEAGEQHQYGGSVHLDDSDGNEIVMWDKQEWIDEPELVIGAIGSCAADSQELLIEELGRKEVIDGCWQ